MKKYVDLIFNGQLIDKNLIFYRSQNPKISVIITVYNGEAYLRVALLSIQNQDFKDIEIIMIDDCSMDNSVNLIKELMKKEPRIVLYQNDKNRGMLYTKVKGISLAKGKYVLLIDEDDIYPQRETFSTLYQEAEKNNLDLLNFNLAFSNPKLENIIIKRSREEQPIIVQPKLREKMFKYSLNGEILFLGGLLTNFFIKRNILIEIIRLIDNKYLNEKMNFHDDFLLFFLLTRNAHSYKKIDRIFYIVLHGWNKTNEKIEFRLKEKFRNIKYIRCNSLLNFIEFMLNKTDNNFMDKKFAFFSFNKWFLNYWCRNFTPIHEKAINISKQFLKNEYIISDDKKKINFFLTEVKYNSKL